MQSHVSVAFPVTADLETDERVRRPAVAALAYRVETTQPAAFAELYKDYSMKGLEVKVDGAVHWFGGLTAFDPNIDMRGRTWGAPSVTLSYLVDGSPAVVDVVLQDLLAQFKYACKCFSIVTLLCLPSIFRGTLLTRTYRPQMFGSCPRPSLT